MILAMRYSPPEQIRTHFGIILTRVVPGECKRKLCGLEGKGQKVIEDPLRVWVLVDLWVLAFVQLPFIPNFVGEFGVETETHEDFGVFVRPAGADGVRGWSEDFEWRSGGVKWGSAGVGWGRGRGAGTRVEAVELDGIYHPATADRVIRVVHRNGTVCFAHFFRFRDEDSKGWVSRRLGYESCLLMVICMIVRTSDEGYDLNSNFDVPNVLRIRNSSLFYIGL